MSEETPERRGMSADEQPDATQTRSEAAGESAGTPTDPADGAGAGEPAEDVEPQRQRHVTRRTHRVSSHSDETIEEEIEENEPMPYAGPSSSQPRPVG